MLGPMVRSGKGVECRGSYLSLGWWWLVRLEESGNDRLLACGPCLGGGHPIASNCCCLCKCAITQCWLLASSTAAAAVPVVGRMDGWCCCFSSSSGPGARCKGGDGAALRGATP